MSEIKLIVRQKSEKNSFFDFGGAPLTQPTHCQSFHHSSFQENTYLYTSSYLRGRRQVRMNSFREIEPSHHSGSVEPLAPFDEPNQTGSFISNLMCMVSSKGNEWDDMCGNIEDDYGSECDERLALAPADSGEVPGFEVEYAKSRDAICIRASSSKIEVETKPTSDTSKSEVDDKKEMSHASTITDSAAGKPSPKRKKSLKSTKTVRQLEYCRQLGAAKETKLGKNMLGLRLKGEPYHSQKSGARNTNKNFIGLRPICSCVW